MNSEFLFDSTIEQIITPEYCQFIKDWNFAAKPNEKKGLYLISKIMKKEDTGTINSKPAETETPQNNALYKEALISYGKLSSSSTYKSHFTSSKNFVYKNVFNDKGLKEMSYSKVLTPQAVVYLSKWIELEQSEENKEYVLEFLRAFYSTIHLNSNDFETIQRRDFVKYNKQDMFTNLSFFSNGSHKKPIPINVSIDEMRKNLKIDELKEKYSKKYGLSASVNSASAFDYGSQELINQKKQELIRGNKNLIKGVYGGLTNTSTYLELFKGYNNRSGRIIIPSESVNLRYVSGIKGKIPDPFMIDIQKGKLDIDDIIKGKVKGIVGGYTTSN